MLVSLLTFTGLGLAAAVLLHWLYNVIVFKLSKLPPGPIPMPVIGNANWFFNVPPNDAMRELQRRYGNVVTVHIGHSTRAVIVIGYKEINDIFGNRETAELVAGRPPLTDSRDVAAGILWADWPAVQEPRKFVSRWLKEFGLSLSGNKHGITTQQMEAEIQSFCDHVENNCNTPLQFQTKLLECVASCVMVPLHGKRLDFSDPISKKMYQNARILFDSNFIMLFLSPFSSIISMFVPDKAQS